MSDFFESGEGAPVRYISSPGRVLARDMLCDFTLALSPRLRKLKNSAGKSAPLQVLIVGIAVPGRVNDISAVIDRLSLSRHNIDTSIVPMEPRGKFENIDAAIRAAPKALNDYDWLIIADDDIAFKRSFLDDFLSLSELAGLSISQPAHKFKSYASWAVTQRRFGSLVRTTQFVEIGPLTAIRREAFADLVPFPASRWCYGIDLYWSHLALERGWSMGVVDATPVSHLRPVGASYDMAAAEEEGREFLKRMGISLSRKEFFKNKIKIGL